MRPLAYNGAPAGPLILAASVGFSGPLEVRPSGAVVGLDAPGVCQL